MTDDLIIIPATDEQYLVEQLISYIGNKRKLVPFIRDVVIEIKDELSKGKVSVFDGFAGSGVVSRSMKKHASVLHTNDLETYARLINECYLSDPTAEQKADINDYIDYLNVNKLTKEFDTGIIEKLYAPADDENIKQAERVFYTNENAKIIDNIRRLIARDVPEEYQTYMLAPLLHQASVHNNTSGVFKGFYKNSSTGLGQFGGNARNCLSRITNEIELQQPIFSAFPCETHVYQADTNELIKTLPEVDIAYYDPPYNQHPYGSNYFMLNVISNYVEPEEVSKVSGIPTDWNKSAYNKKAEAITAFASLIGDTKAKYILISYNTEGILSVDELTAIFERFGKVTLRKKVYPVFRARRKSETLTHRNLDELIFVVQK